MNKKILIALTAAAIAGTWAMPAFAHHRDTTSCGNRDHAYHNEEVCGSYCEDGVLCGTDGHYCGLHTNEDCGAGSCKGGTWTNENCDGHSGHHSHGC